MRRSTWNLRSFRISSTHNFVVRRAKWSSASTFLIALLNLGLGTVSSVVLPETGTLYGLAAVLAINVFCFIVIARPIAYVEMFISQFTSRDCIDIWSIRPLLSHIGYITVFWQILILFANHVETSFILHYLLITFENPIPFYYCHDRNKTSCGIFRNNITVNEHCTGRGPLAPYCKGIYKTYSEYLYWQNDLLDIKNPNSFVLWKIVLCSSIISVILYLCVFKRTTSLKYVITVFAFYPMSSYLAIAMGAMLQQGLVDKFEEVMNTRLTSITSNYRFSYTVTMVMFSLKLGTGLLSTMASTAHFRSQCQSNATVLAVTTSSFNVLTIVTTCMFFCTYIYVNDVPLYFIIEHPVSFQFVKVPLLLHDFSPRHLWLFLFFSSNLILGISCSALSFFCLLELASRRYPMVAEYPGLYSFFGVLVLFFLSIPLMSRFGITTYIESIIDYSLILTPFMAFLEGIVFVLTYGMNRFSEDMHFLQGQRPDFLRKLFFITALLTMGWATVTELSWYFTHSDSDADYITNWLLISFSAGLVVLIILLKILVAAWKRELGELFRLDPKWGPNSEMLRRSRDMFSAHAITKEYVYRQNQLQAGIAARQARSNVRDTCARLTRHHITLY